MRRQAARFLRRTAHQLDPDTIESIDITWTEGEPPWVDIRLRQGYQVTGYVNPVR